MSKKKTAIEGLYATESLRMEIDPEILKEAQGYGWLSIGDKNFYERELVLFAIKEASDKSLSDFKKSLIIEIENKITEAIKLKESESNTIDVGSINIGINHLSWFLQIIENS